MIADMKKKLGLAVVMVVLIMGASAAVVPATAYAASGDLTIIGGSGGFGGTVFESPCVNPGFNTGSSPYLGSIDCNGVYGVPGCFDVNMVSDVAINKHATATTMVLDNTVFTITAAPGCGSSAQSCQIVLADSHTLTDGAFNAVGGVRSGTFAGTSATGPYTIPAAGSCPALGLRQLIESALSSDPYMGLNLPTTLEV